MILFEGKLITEEEFNRETERLKKINHKVIKEAVDYLKENKINIKKISKKYNFNNLDFNNV